MDIINNNREYYNIKTINMLLFKNKMYGNKLRYFTIKFVATKIQKKYKLKVTFQFKLSLNFKSNSTVKVCWLN